MANFLEASKDPSREMESIALANLALAKFQVNDVDGSLRVARDHPSTRSGILGRSRAGHGGAVGVRARTDAEAEWSRCAEAAGGSARRCPRRTRGTGAGNRRRRRAAGLLEQQVRLFQSLYQPVRAFRLTLRLTWSVLQVAQQAAVVRGTIGADGARRDGREFGGNGGGGGGGRDGGKCPVSNVRVHGDRRRRGGRRDAPRRWTRF